MREVTESNNKELWKKILKELKKQNPSVNFSKILNKGKIEKITENKIFISLDKENIELINSQWLPHLKWAIHVSTNKNLLLEFKAQSDEHELIEKSNQFIKNHNFSNFFLCKYNEALFENFKKAIEEFKSINIFYLWGNVGVGKSHFVGALISYFSEKISSIYIDSLEFINKLYYYKKSNKSTQTIIEWLLNYDLIVFDSFQEIKNKKSVNNIFLQIINKITSFRKKIVFVSDTKKYPFEDLEEKLISKFQLISNLEIPDIEDLKIIVNKLIKEQNKNIKFSNDATLYLIGLLGNNIRVIINKLSSIFLFFENADFLKVIDIEELKKILKRTSFFRKEKEILNFSNNQQIKIICKKLNFDVNEILKPTRKKDIVFQRNIVIFLLKNKFHLTHENIGKIFNKKHSSITHSLKVVGEKLLEPNFKRYIENFF